MFNFVLAQADSGELTRVCGQDPSTVCRELLKSTDSGLVAEIGGWIAGSGLRILVILAGAFVVSRMARRLIKTTTRAAASDRARERMKAAREMTPKALVDTGEHSLRSTQRLEALTTLLGSLSSAVIGLIATFMVLGELGIDLGPLLAGAGVAGIALGFGAQSVVRDFLSGIFILLEDQYGVGDIIDLGDGVVAGTVESVGLMSTRLRAIDGTTWHVANGNITQVGNKSQHWSRSLLDIEVAYGSDIEQVKAVLKRVADEVADEDSDVLEEPSIWGVESLGANGVVIRFAVKTTPAEQWRISRELRERIKLAFDREGIEIPFPQVTTWHRTEGAGDGGGGG